MVVLKRLDDAERDGDASLGVIRGAAVNQDGRSNGLTAPERAVAGGGDRAALADAGVDPADVGYVEAHGTAPSSATRSRCRRSAPSLGRDRADRPPPAHRLGQDATSATSSRPPASPG